jgi:hypothetical protein
MGPDVETAQGVPASTSDGVLVVSVWLEGAEGFLGRMTATAPDGETTMVVVSSPDDLLEEVAAWLRSLR